MEGVHTQLRKFEEYAYVLDFKSRGYSSTVRGRIGIIVTAIGKDRLTLLEILGLENSTFDVGERIYIGKEGRTKVQSVLGKIDYAKISDSAQSDSDRPRTKSDSRLIPQKVIAIMYILIPQKVILILANPDSEYAKYF